MAPDHNKLKFRQMGKELLHIVDKFRGSNKKSWASLALPVSSFSPFIDHTLDPSIHYPTKGSKLTNRKLMQYKQEQLVLSTIESSLHQVILIWEETPQVHQTIKQLKYSKCIIVLTYVSIPVCKLMFHMLERSVYGSSVSTPPRTNM